MGLDWVENQFFTEDGQFIQCATHGAYYLPDTGEGASPGRRAASRSCAYRSASRRTSSSVGVRVRSPTTEVHQ
jgi:hypothetical protein